MQPAHVSLWLRSETAPKGQQTDKPPSCSPKTATAYLPESIREV
jgi:hypothetical protein